MSNPILIENSFQTLKHTLKYISGKRLKIFKIITFLDLLTSDMNKVYLKVYLVEILNILHKTVQNTDFTGTNVVFFDRVIDSLNLLVPELKEKEMKILHNKIIHTLEKNRNLITETISNKIRNSENKFLQKNSLNIPLVEKEFLLKSQNPDYTTIKDVTVSLSFASKSINTDTFHIQQHFSNSDNINNLEILQIAKEIFQKLSGVKIREKLVCSCIFEKNFSVIGDSMKAGLTALIIAELFKLYQIKEEYFFNSEIAITGAITNTGFIGEIDEAGLKLKIEACCFSKIKYLVVPKTQEALAQKFLENISAEYFHFLNEGVLLEVIGLVKIEDIFYNNKLVARIKVPFIKLAIRQLWRSRRIVAVGIIFILLIIVFRLNYGPIDKNPVDYKLEANVLWLLNKYGEKIDSLLVPDSSIYAKTGSELIPYLILKDINNDNKNELVISINDGVRKQGRLEVISTSSKKVLWSKEYYKNFICPNDPITSDHITLGTMKSGDYDLDGKNELYVTGVSGGYFPGLLMKINVETGEMTDYYLNDGNFSNFDFVDLNGDGVDEMILTGYNNSYREKAALIILDPGNIGGYTPVHSKRHHILNQKTAKEKKYILIPRTIVGEALKLEGAGASAIIEWINKKKKTFLINITEITIPGKKYGSPQIYILFDFNLKILKISTNDAYNIYADYLFKEKRIPIIPDSAYWSDYIKNLSLSL